MKKIYTYKVTGYKMKKDVETWEMKRSSFVSQTIAFSRLKEINTIEDKEFFECEISLQFKCDYFELDGIEYINSMNEAQLEDRNLGNI